MTATALGRRLSAALPTRQARLTVTLFALLIAAILALGARAAAPPYDLYSSGPTGLLALRLWLEEMDYRVVTTGGERFDPPTADLLFVYPGRQPFTEDEVDALVAWVRQGGTLVLVAPSDGALTQVLGARQQAGSPLAVTAPLRQLQPILPDAPAGLGQIGIGGALDLAQARAAVPVLGADAKQATAAVRSLDRGTVWFLSRQHDLTNAALREKTPALLVPALLRTVPAGGVVAFDAYHLYGATGTQRQTIQGWLAQTPAGWAILFSVLIVFAFLLLQGARLGRPLPATRETRRREAAEYVVAMAGLQRRARLGEAVAAYHRRRLKRTLGQRLGISPELTDEEFVRALAAEPAGAGLAARARETLAALSGQADEAALVRHVGAIDEILER